MERGRMLEMMTDRLSCVLAEPFSKRMDSLCLLDGLKGSKVSIIKV